MKKLFENFRRFVHEGVTMRVPTPIESLPEEGKKLADLLSSSGEWEANLTQVLELGDLMGNPLPIKNYEIYGEGGDRYAVLEFDTKEDKYLWWELLRKAGLNSHTQEEYYEHSMMMLAGKDGAEYHAIYIDNPLPKD